MAWYFLPVVDGWMRLAWSWEFGPIADVMRIHDCSSALLQSGLRHFRVARGALRGLEGIIDGQFVNESEVACIW